MERPAISTISDVPDTHGRLGGSLLDLMAERIYARSNRALLGIGFAIAFVNAAIATVAAVLTAIPHVELTLSEATRVGITTGVMTLVALLLLWPVAKRRFAPIAAWLADKTEEAAPATWSSAAEFTLNMVRFGVLIFTIAFLPITALVTIAAEIPWYGVPFVFAFTEFGILFAAILDYFAFERLLLPLFRDLARFLPADFVPELRTPPLRLRIFFVITLVSVFTAIVISGFQPEGASVTTKLIFALIVPIVISLTLGFAPLMFLTQSVVGPIARLQEAVGRVERADLSVHAPVLGADEVGHLTGSFNRMVRGLRERATLHSTVAAYIDPAIAEKVMAEGSSSIAGEAAEVTVMFLDIVGFTAMAEDAQPEEVVSDLNEFFNIAIPVIVRHGGHANKLLGDGLMAVFGVPEKLPDHADRALAAAREIQARLHERYAGALKAGIGLNSGTVVVGSMGGGPKLDYTIIGDAVNVAARIEAFTRQTGDDILLTHATKNLLTSQSGLKPRGKHSLKGRAATVEVWAG